MPIKLWSQRTILDSNPPSVKWERISTPYFHVIFPAGFEKEAQRTANLLETVYEPGALSLNKFPKKTSVILQNQSTVSNGFVAWAPYRSEFFTYPAQDYLFIGNNDWLELLSFHEYRHMVQIQKSKTGFNKLVNVLFGQATTGNMAKFAVPNWFWEGDATIMETALTSSGRGRNPGFSLEMRSNLLEKGAFTYNKQYLRSFKDFVPDEYTTGYFFGGYLRNKHDAEIFDRVTESAWNWSFVPFTFSNALKKHTGNYLVKNYKEFISSQKEIWQRQVEILKVEDYTALNLRKNNVFTHYRYPHLMPSGKILALKSGMGDIAEFVLVDEEGQEETLVIPGFINGSGRISFNGAQIIWNEFTPDVRWQTRIYSDVKLYDLEKNTIEKLSAKGRLASSAISPDGTQIVSIKNDEKGENSIEVTDMEGNLIATYLHHANVHHITPDWSEDGESFYAIEIENRNKRIVRHSVEDPTKRTVIFEAEKENISYPKVFDNLLFYQSTFNGLDNIYVIDLSTNLHYQATNARYGAYFPFYDPATSTLYFSDHQEYGLNIAKKTLNIHQLPLKSNVPVYRDPLARQLTAQESGIISPDDVTEHDFPFERYNKIKGIINPHSWGLTLGNSINELNFFVNSTDIRSTTQINAGYAYNINEQKGRWEAGISYHGLFPVTGITFTDSQRGISEEILDTARSFSWNEKGVELGLIIPLQLTQNKYRKSLVMQGRGGLFKVNNFPLYPFNSPDEYEQNGNLQTLKLDMVFNRLLKTSQRDLFSKWGQRLEIVYNSTPFSGDYQGSLFAVQGSLFFPGLSKHHSFYIRPGYQYQTNDNYIFNSPLLFPRGYTYTPFDHFYMASANYSLPIFYPDLGIGPLLYIQRVKANVFYDIGRGTRDSPYDFITSEKLYQSIGLELNFDFNVLRYKQLLDMGFRINYLPEENSFSYNLLIGRLGF